MRKGEIKSVFQHTCFWLLVILMLWFLPNRISYHFFCLSALVCPIECVQDFVDEMLSIWSVRGLLILVIVFLMGFMPLSEFKSLGSYLIDFLSSLA